MNRFRTIEIDLDVHQKIELERKNFEEAPNDVLRRLLKIKGRRRTHLPATQGDGGAWTSKGVTLPHGTELRMKHRGHEYHGVVKNGYWIVKNKRFKSPSGAASAVARTRDGRSTRLDGWLYWYVKRPGDTKWLAIDDLRN